MIELEKFISNLDIEDKLGIKDVNIDKSVNYRGAVDLIKKNNNVDDPKIPPLASAVVGLNNTNAPLPHKPDYYTAWTDIDAQDLFLKSKPTCYLILSKPGTGAYSLGEAISQKLNCIHMCPRNAIIDEIEQKSPTGRCLDFNMRHNKALKFDDIFPIIKEKLKSSAVSHRGYVMSGLPLVTTSWSEKYLMSGLNGEEPILAIDDLLYDMIVNLKKKKPKKKKEDSGSVATSLSSGGGAAEGEEEAEEEVEPEEENLEEEEVPVELPKFLLEQCSNIISLKETSMHSKKIILMKQLIQIMDLPMTPDIIIYITCTDKDAVFKKEHTFLNYTSSSIAYESIPNKVPTDLRWPTKYTLDDSVNRHDSQILNSKYNCKPPMNFKEHSVQQMCNYKNHLLNFIEKKLEEFEPKTIIKLNGCTMVDQMMSQVTERLLLLPIKPVLIPEPMLLEEPPDEMEEFWQLVDQLNVIQSNGVRFNRYASPWFNRCPVELKYRQSTRGNPKFAVALFKHVYIMSTLQKMIQFCRNPRPFLELTYLEPTCRAIIIGTKSSGKTMIAQCLSWVFDAPYICYKTFLANEKQKKFDSYAKSILSEIIATIEDKRFNVWQTAESERVIKMDSWYNSTLQCLVNYYPLLVETLLMAEEEEIVGAEHEQERENAEKPPPDPEFEENFEIFRNKLLFLPFIDDVEQVKLAISDKSILLFHCPTALITPTVKPGIPALGDADVTEAVNDYIVLNELQNEIQPTPEELMTEMVKILGEIDTKTAEETNNEKLYGKWVIDGFPTEPEFWGFLSEFNCMPDYSIALIENRELEPELMQHYALVENSVKVHEERFLLANDPLIKIKLRTKKPSNTKPLDVKIILDDYQTTVLNSIFDVPQQEDTPDFGAEITAFTESIDKVREDWNGIKSKLDEINKCYIEIELENKSDVEVTEEVLLKMRQGYYLPCVPGESEEPEEVADEDDAPKDLLTFNMPYFVSETNIYCPIAFYNHGVLWEGKPEFSIKYDNKVHFFSKEECLNEIFSKDVTKYQSYNQPFKNIPPLRICVIGCIGSGKTTISKYIAKELGLVYIDFAEIVNDYLMPRHFKKVGRKYENSFTSGPVEEEGAVELLMDEENQNLEADLLSNENELRRMVDNYFERGSPLLSLLMQKLIKKLWFQKPFSETGFVLDGFPRMPSDVEDMMSCYCIPDLIIEIEGSSEVAIERLAQKMFKTWKVQLNEAKQKSAKKFNIVKQEWFDFITKKVVCKLLCDEIIDGVIPPEISVRPLSNESVVIDVNQSTILNKDLMDAYNDIIQEFPEPIDLSEWEKPDEVLERIEGRIEGIFEVDDENIQSLKDIVSEQRIKSISINNTKPLYKVLRIVLAKLVNVRNRCGSILEQTFIIASDVAETLLLEGFFFLSKFNRMCPVHIFENPDILLNPYKVMQSKDMVYAVVHRCYIYFISGIKSLQKFRTDPLKYIINNNINNFVLYPLRFSVIGPPKSGKSTLAMKLAEKYGLLCVSKGMALRYILENMHWTELGSKMIAALSEGKCIETDLIMKAVQIVAINHRLFSNGFVFDGFPDNPPEAMELLNTGLYPLVIFDISSKKETILENSQKEVYSDILKYKPNYSIPLIEYRFMKWSEKSDNVRNWVKDDVQNIYILNGNESRWQCLQDAQNRINWVTPRVHYYLTHCETDIVSAEVMCISNVTFQQKMTSFKNMCPVCLRNNVLRHSDFLVDKKGLVQFKNRYYWICAEHMNLVLTHPDHYLATQPIDIPEIPAVVKTVNTSLVYENGICIVTYAERLPSQIIERGSSKFAANFQGNTYMFCSDNCLKKFLAKPQLYYNVVVFKNAKLFSPLSLKGLPHIGYLEQTLGNLITEACCSVNVLRPKYPGLDVQLSGLLYIALYLKTHNVLLDKSFLAKYLKSFTTYEARCKLMIDVGLRLRTIDNPFAHYPICCDNKNKKSQNAMRSSYSTNGGTSLSVLITDFRKSI